jgi:hypothetical protein
VEPVTTTSTLELISKGIALIGAICIGFSVIYDWGYLYGLGLGFHETPTSLADHLRSAIIWLPYAIGFFAFARGIGAYLAYRDSARLVSQDESDRKDKRENWIALIAGVTGIGLWILLGDRVIAFAAFGLKSSWWLYSSRHPVRLA